MVASLLLAMVAVSAAWVLDGYVARRRTQCTEMRGMMVGMTAGMTTGLVVGVGAGAVTDMFWSNLIGLLVAVPLGGYLGRHGRLVGVLDGAMAGVMGGMMGAMLGVMLQFSVEYALITGILLLAGQIVALVSVAHLVDRADSSLSPPRSAAKLGGAVLPAPLPDYYSALGIGPRATARDVAAAYLALTDPAAPALAPERLRHVDEALAVLSDPFRRLTYDRARSLPTAAPPAIAEAPTARPDHAHGVGERQQPKDSTPHAAATAFPRGRGTAVLVVLAIAAFSLVAVRPVTAGCPPPPPAAIPSTGAVTVAPDGKQVINLTIQYPCYYPDRMTIQRGVPVQFAVSTVGDPGCGRQMIFRGLGISRIAVPGQITTVEFTPERAGTYSINCGMNMMRAATLQVVD